MSTEAKHVGIHAYARKGPAPFALNGRKRAFAVVLGIVGGVRRAARVSGVSARSHYRWLTSDHEYRQAVAAARLTIAARLEEECRRRAIDGVRRLKFDKHGRPLRDEYGKQYEERVYSDVLLIFLLKANAPAKFAPERTFRHTNSTTILDAEWYSEQRSSDPKFANVNANQISTSGDAPQGVGI